MAAEQILELESELERSQAALSSLQLQQDTIALLYLTPEDVAQGSVGDGKKGRAIAQIIKRLSKNLDKNYGFIVEQLQAVHESYREQTGEVKPLTVTDTGDARVTLEIGSIPVGSCQNYRGGVVNEALLGYTDPNTKVLWVTNERGKPIARSMSRLLSDEAGNPVLHVETIYAAEASDSVNRSVMRHAIEKGETMRIPVLMSSTVQNVDGELVPMHAVSGISTQPVTTTLTSSSSRAPYVYVDSAGGRSRNGVYEIKDLVRLSEARPM